MVYMSNVVVVKAVSTCQQSNGLNIQNVSQHSQHVKLQSCRWFTCQTWLSSKQCLLVSSQTVSTFRTCLNIHNMLNCNRVDGLHVKRGCRQSSVYLSAVKRSQHSERVSTFTTCEIAIV